MYNVITYKDIAALLNVSPRTAQKYLADMKKHYNPKSKAVTMAHFNDYFAIPLEDMR